MMEVFITDFKSLRSLKVPPQESPHRLQKSVAVPMKVDEKQKAETIEILSNHMKDAVDYRFQKP